MPRVAILGAGFMGATHARAYCALPGVEIAAIYAPSGERAVPLAAEVGSRWSDDLAAVIADGAVDAVDVCLPTAEHRRATEAALDAGKHVLLEKPIALTAEDADALVARAAAGDRVVMVAHVLRFWPEYVAIRERIAAGEVGRPRSGFASRRQPFPAWSALFARADLTGGAVVDMMVHDFDALNWIFGAPRAATARGERNPRSGGFDQVQVVVDYDGASALVDGGMTMPGSYPFSSRLEVLGERGALEYRFRAGGRGVESGVGENELTAFPNEGDPVRVTPPQTDPYVAEIAYFVDCLRTGRSAERATPADARQALRVALAARASLERGGETVAVPR